MSQRLLSLFAATQLPQGELRTFLEQVANDAISPSLLNFPATVTWVASNGNDATGQRGNPGAPFATLQAAVNASTPGDTLMIAPGIYPAPWTIPGDLSLSVIGEGFPGSIQVGPLNWSPSGGGVLWIEAIALAGATLVDPTPNTAVFVSVRSDYSAGSGLSIVGFNGVFLYDITGLISVVDTLFGRYRCQGARLWVNTSAPLPGQGDHEVDGRYTGLNALRCLGHTRMRAGQGVVADELRVGELGVAPLGSSGLISFYGTAIQASVETSFANDIDLSGINVPGVFVANHTGVAPLVIDARNSDIALAFLSAAPGSGPLTLDTSGGANPDLNASTYGAGTFWRRLSGGARLLGVASGGPTPITWASLGGTLPGAPFPPGDVVSYVSQGETDSLFIQAPTPNGFDLVNNFGGPQNVSVVYHLVG